MSLADAPEGSDGRTIEPPAINDMVNAVHSLINLMGSGGIRELDLSFGDVSIRLRGQGQTPGAASVAVLPSSGTSSAVVEPQIASSLITAPMIGTFYSSPSPADPPFVAVGERIEAGQVVGIIEAMKIMNEIVADRAGIITEILVTNGEAVEYGSPLFRVSLEDTFSR